MRILEILSLIIALAAILAILFYLITGFSKAVWFLEPKLWIRIPEIVMGIFACVFLTKMIIKGSQEIKSQNK